MSWCILKDVVLGKQLPWKVNVTGCFCIKSGCAHSSNKESNLNLWNNTKQFHYKVEIKGEDLYAFMLYAWVFFYLSLCFFLFAAFKLNVCVRLLTRNNVDYATLHSKIHVGLDSKYVIMVPKCFPPTFFYPFWKHIIF